MESRHEAEKKRRLRQGLFTGGIIGLALWAYDYRHIVTGSAPSSPVSDFMRESIPAVSSLCKLGVEGLDLICLKVFPLFILVTAGMAIGGLVMYVKFKSRQVRTAARR